MALILFSFDRIKNSFLVGMRQTSNIFYTKRVEVRIDCIGDLKVSTKVSWSSKLSMTGNILPGASLWL